MQPFIHLYHYVVIMRIKLYLEYRIHRSKSNGDSDAFLFIINYFFSFTF